MDVCVCVCALFKKNNGENSVWKAQQNPSLSWELLNSYFQWEDKYQATNLPECAHTRVPAGHCEDRAVQPLHGASLGMRGRRRKQQRHSWWEGEIVSPMSHVGHMLQATNGSCQAGGGTIWGCVTSDCAHGVTPAARSQQMLKIDVQCWLSFILAFSMVSIWR